MEEISFEDGDFSLLVRDVKSFWHPASICAKDSFNHSIFHVARFHKSLMKSKSIV
jgi:hypothetical protein